MNLNPIRNFLDGSSMNAWIQVEDFEIYVRDTRHLLCRGRIGNTFDIASINLPDSAKRSQGLFKQLLEEIQNLLEEYPRIDAIYIESVINLRLEDYLRRSNFKEVILYPNSFYRLTHLNQKGERDAHV